MERREAVREFLEEGSQRFLSAAEARGVAPMPRGSREVAAVGDGDFAGGPVDEDFLDLVTGNDPRYGAALLVYTRGYVDDHGDLDQAAQPYPAGNGYEVFVFGRRGPRSIDFWRAETSGRFYAYKTLPDDTSESTQRPAPGSALDPFYAIEDAARVIGALVAVARAMSPDPEGATLRFAFRWSGLRGREISDWGHQDRMISPNRIAQADQAFSEIAVPLRTPVEDLPPMVRTAVRPLFGTFGWEEENPNLIPNVAAHLLARNPYNT